MANKNDTRGKFLSDIIPHLFAGAVGSVATVIVEKASRVFGFTLFSDASSQAIAAFCAFVLFLPIPTALRAFGPAIRSLRRMLNAVAAKGDRIAIIIANLE